MNHAHRLCKIAGIASQRDDDHAMNAHFPTLFLSHGSPMMALEDRPTTRAWHQLGASLPRPRAVLLISAHHHARSPMLTAAAAPATIHDFGGFPPALHQVQYPAPGDGDLANDVVLRLRAAGFVDAAVDVQRGIDHGVWVPLRHIYPDADVPVVSLSVSPSRDACWHYALGQAIATLRDEGIFIIGSGGLTHNLGALDWHGRSLEAAPWAQSFADWFVANLHSQNIDALLEWRQSAPEPERNHPTPEHLLPIFVAMGAARRGFSTEVIEPGFDLGSLALHALRFY